MQKVKVLQKKEKYIKEKKYVQYDSCKSTGHTLEAVQLIECPVYIRLINIKSISHMSLCGCALDFQFGINLLI